jgi:thiaminase/transcriptional activator TenA
MSFFAKLKAAAADDWQAYTEHPFTEALGDGTLPEAAFQDYLVQDYLFLIEFARAYALAAYKAPRLSDMREAAAAMAAILDVEMDLHISLSGKWGLSASDLEASEAAPETLAYTRYVLDAGMRGDLLALKVALSPCVIGYAEIASRLATYPGALSERNPYATWIAEYSGAAYQELAASAEAGLEDLARRYLTPARETELVAVFREATRLEADFWGMGWRVGAARV